MRITLKETNLFERLGDENYEQIVYCQDRDSGLKAIVAIHDSTLGPGTGGCRMYPYASETEALEDVLRLSKGMTYKASISGLNLGGAKAVIIGDPRTVKTEALLKRFGRFVEGLGGRYITAKDVGITGPDLQIIQTQTKHILGIEGVANSSGDPSPVTAWGVYNGMKAAVKKAFGSDSLQGRTIAVQGLGYVSYTLVEYLTKEGAKVIAADIDRTREQLVQSKFGVSLVPVDEILGTKCDVFSPNAMGGAINAKTIPQLQCKVVAGAANNQLATDEDGFELMRRGILYAPDYAINAGGLVNIYHELGGYNKERAYDYVAGIYRTIENILDRSEKEKLPPHRVADLLAEERIAAAKQKKI